MQPGQDFDNLVRLWTPYAETWAHRQECRLPGTDWWGVANDALWRAARTFDPDKGFQFSTWLRATIRNCIRGTLRRHRRRAAKLTRVGMPRDDLRLMDSQARGRFACSDPGPRLVDACDEAAPWLAAMGRLDPRNAEVIRRAVMGGDALTNIERSWGAGRHAAARRLAEGLEELRAIAVNGCAARRLHPPS